MSNPVFVLGAGFSRPGGIPVLNEFFDEVKKHINEVNSDKERKRFEYTLKLENYIIQNKIKERPDMESAFVFIDDLQKEKIQKLPGFEITVEELRRHFLYTIFRTFSLCWIHDSPPYGRGNKYKDKGKEFVIKHLYKNYIFSLLRTNATVITFNYDLIIDNLLMMNDIVPKYSNNRVEYLNKKDIEDKGHNLEFSNNFKLLKLHGSLNWFICNKCKRIYIKIDVEDNYSTNGDDYTATSGDICKCGQRMDFIIIPPAGGKSKPEKPEFLNNAWTIAEEELKTANEITFIGYSFPHTDENIRESFQKLINENSLLKRVRVINKEINDELVSKYECVFGEINKRKIEYYQTSFEDWMINSLGD